MYWPNERRAKMVCGVFIALMAIFSFAQPRISMANTAFCQTINSLPMVINRSGVYCLKRDLLYRASAGAALEVRRNNVVIDLNGFRIFGTAALGNETVGIKVSNKQKVRITNGTIERFRVGIELDRGIANSVDNVHLDQNRQFGIWQGGAGKSLTIVDNTISRTGGSTSPVLPGSFSSDIASAVLIGDGDPPVFGVRFERNTVFDVRNVGASSVISGVISLGNNGLYRENSISGRGLSVALGVSGSNNAASENSLVNETLSGIGLSMTATNVYVKNTAVNFEFGYFGFGANRGGNVAAP